MNFEYNFQSITPMEQNGLIALLAVYAVLLLVVLAFTVVCYVFQSVSLCSIARRRGIRGGWLAWFPIGYQWVLGSIADHYQYVAKGQIRNRRKALLISTIAAPVLMALMCVGYMGLLYDMFAGTPLGNVLVCALLVIVSGLLLLAAQIMCLVVQYISCYNLYASCAPETATIFLILSLFFPITLPFFLWASRKKDLGMPPKKQSCAPAAPFPETVLPQPPVPEAEQDDFVL